MKRDRTPMDEALADLRDAVWDEVGPGLYWVCDRVIDWWVARRCFLCRERRYDHPLGQTRGCWRRH